MRDSTHVILVATLLTVAGCTSAENGKAKDPSTQPLQAVQKPASAPMEHDARLDRALMSVLRNSGDGDDAQSIRKIEALLNSGASPSAPDETGAALVYAISRDRPATAKLLRERGAKVDWSRLPENLQLQPFRLSYSLWFVHKLDRLRELESLGMPLDPFGAAILGREDRLRELLADPKWKPTTTSSTTVYFAADQGQTACLRLLLDAGGDPNERIPSWDTPDIGPRPLDGAALNGHAETVQLLLQRGADPKLMTLKDEDWQKVNEQIRQMLGRK